MSDMQLYILDRDALQRALKKRSWEAKTLARVSGVHIRTVRRCLGEEYPPNMPENRRDMVRSATALRLAAALRVHSQEIAPDLPEKSPRANPPSPPPDPPRSELANWRSRRQMADVRRRRLEVRAPELEVDIA